MNPSCPVNRGSSKMQIRKLHFYPPMPWVITFYDGHLAKPFTPWLYHEQCKQSLFENFFLPFSSIFRLEIMSNLSFFYGGTLRFGRAYAEFVINLVSSKPIRGQKKKDWLHATWLEETMSERIRELSNLTAHSTDLATFSHWLSHTVQVLGRHFFLKYR